MKIKIFTVGFTKKTAQEFFGALKSNGVRKLIDVRLNNNSQLAGFTKQKDLEYFLREIASIDYEHRKALSPSKEILSNYRKNQMTWDEYEREFIQLIREREIEKTISPDELDGACLLCSEHTPHCCHRRLVAEYLQEKWEAVEIEHI